MMYGQKVSDFPLMPNVPDEVSLLASGTKSCDSNDVTEVPKGQGLAQSARSHNIPTLVKKNGLENWYRECSEAFTAEGKLRISLNQNSPCVLSSPDGQRVELTPDNWKTLVGDRLEVEFYPGQVESREAVLLAIQEKLDKESPLYNLEGKSP
jgi:hypothetical protein